MKKRLLLILIVVLGAILLAPITRADVPTLISYQGVLLDSEGDPVTEPVNVTFTIYDSPSEGAISWQETQSVEFDESGRFDVSLGETTPIADDVFSDPVRWLGVQVEGDDELVPRTRMVSVAYANRISTVDGASGGVISGDVTIQSDLSVNGDISATGKATIGPGHTNTGLNAFVAGENNIADGDNSTVGGGNFNTASGLGSVIAGGYAGIASGENATIGGGWHNLASGSVGTVAGGQEDTASGAYSTVAGGIGNLASAWGSSVGGGQSNTASGSWSTVPGGNSNNAEGIYSLAAGLMAKAYHNGSFVWSDATGSNYESTADNQFLIRASGGVGIGTNNPTSALHVEGEVKSVVAGVNFYMVPQGAIIMWSGLLANIPGGWALCDGDGGTPDLRNRFIYGCSASENPGATGGSIQHSHSVDISPFWSAANGQSWWGASGGISQIANHNHSHIVDPPQTNSSSNNHLPSYFKLAFIMKM